MGAVWWLTAGWSAAEAVSSAPADYETQIEPILRLFCFDCHADGARKGGVAMDEYPSHEARLADRDQWFKVLKNVRSGLMPPAKKPHPDAEQKRVLSK
jgi:hypothetical protein